MAELLGLRIRGDGDFGTTIVIVDFYDTNHECKEDATSLLSRLKESQEWYYYPTLIDGRFKSTFKFGQGDQSPDPFSEPDSSGFAEAYKLVTKGEETEDFAFRRFSVPIPANPEEGFDEGREADFLLGVKFSEVEVYEEPEANQAKPRDNTIAWVRGAGLAVTHERQTHIGNPTKKFHGVLICGTQVERVFTDEGYDDEAQKMAERLISYSENVSHDEISDSSSLVHFQQWPNSSETIKRIKKKLRSELKKIVSDKGSDNPKGTAAPRFNLSFGTDGKKPRPRVISIINLNTSNPDHENWYQTSFTLRIPPSDSKDLLLEKDTEEAEYFTKWQVEVPLNFIEEDGGINSDKIPGSVVTIQEMKPDGTWTNLMKDGDCEYSPDSSDTSWVSGNFNSQWRTISIDIQTDFIDSYKASYGKVRAKPTTRLGREVDAS